MRRFGRLYGGLLASWLTVIVYLWTLEAIAIFGIRDPEPFLNQFADWSAILWTLVFWTVVAVLIASFIVQFANHQSALLFNEQLVKTALILVTAIYFARWMFTWKLLLGSSVSVRSVLLGMTVILALWVWRRRRSLSQSEVHLSSLRDVWFYLTIPVLILSVIALFVTVGQRLLSIRRNQEELRRVVQSEIRNQTIQSRPNVVLIVGDALRAASMSLHGYNRETTPFLERFAQTSTVYDQMHSNSTSTRPSLTTILTGKHPLTHGRLTKFLPPYNNPENLLNVLRRVGYTTAVIASNSDARLEALGFTRELVYGEYSSFRNLTLSWLRDNRVFRVSPTTSGDRMYDELAQVAPFIGFPKRTLGYGSAEVTFDRAFELISRLPEPFFLFVHVHEPHNPYWSPPPFRGRYAKIDYHAANAEISSEYYNRYPPRLQPFVDAHRDHYDESIEYLDSELERFVMLFDQNQKSRKSLLIITGDHGESFERGFLNHGEDLYETSIHVPLIVKFSGQKVGFRSAAPVQSIDIAPTILHAAGITVPQWIDGVPLTGEETSSQRETVTVNYKDPEGRKIYNLPTKVAIQWREYKLIVNCASGKTELYDLSQDPGELTDLSSRQTTRLNELWKKLNQRLATQQSARKLICQLGPQP